MRKQPFNDHWTVRKKGEPYDLAKQVILPHDAMIHEERAADSPGGGAHGYFPGGVYVYEKTFMAPEEWKQKHIYLEFEGVYKDSVVEINGKKAGGQGYGYIPFLICMDEFLLYGQENQVKVTVDNSLLPNSRWYTGSGIYRPVNLLTGEKTHIHWRGVKITTISSDPPKIRVDVSATGGMPVIEIWEENQRIASAKGNHVEMDIPDGKTWSAEFPYLYQCRVFLEENGKITDEVTETFGIRTLTWNESGFFVNGKETLLRGGCLHHDNGILGAASWEKSEWRRIRILKEEGFNAIRSAHNPASEAILRACDACGMYVIDESFDMWYNRKNKYDYGQNFETCWEKDTTAMVERDYNHPSVIMYSIGNEVAEPAEEKGLSYGKQQIALIHQLDPTRPVTCGINLMIMGKAAKGKGIYQDGETNTKEKPQQESEKKEKNSSLAFNIMATFIGTGMNKSGNSKKVDAVSSPFADSLDIAGYNYGSGRYPLEGKEHPKRVIFGSETFPQDIYKNWKMVKQYPYLIGDFMWIAWDYLGEAGIGAWSYTGGMPFNRPYPWLLSGAGVIDILGFPDPTCKYAGLVWEQRTAPVIGVRPLNHPGVRVSKSVWRGTNAMESWSWSGCEGNKTIVEVYAQGKTAELFLNGKSLGRKKLKEKKALFHVKYQPGILKTIIYDSDERECGHKELQSAEGSCHLELVPEETTINAQDIVYVNVSICGANGEIESNNDMELTCTVSGGILLGFGSANPCPEESYDSGRCRTYYGRAQAVVYAPEAGEVGIKMEGSGLKGQTCIKVKSERGDDHERKNKKSIGRSK